MKGVTTRSMRVEEIKRPSVSLGQPLMVRLVLTGSVLHDDDSENACVSLIGGSMLAAELLDEVSACSECDDLAVGLSESLHTSCSRSSRRSRSSKRRWRFHWTRWSAAGAS